MKARYNLLLILVALAGCNAAPVTEAPSGALSRDRLVPGELMPIGDVSSDQTSTTLMLNEADRTCAAFHSEDLHERCLALMREETMRNMNWVRTSTAGGTLPNR